MRLTWLSDLHLDHADKEAVGDLLDSVNEHEPDVVVITGDTAEATSLKAYLEIMSSVIKAPIYFVCGNHDYYKGDIAHVREFVCKSYSAPPLVYLPQQPKPVQLDVNTALIGIDGWGDARVGAFTSTHVMLADWYAIQDFKVISALSNMRNRNKKLHELGSAEAAALRLSLNRALAGKGDTVYVAMHAPPFWEASWHEGKKSDKFWAPWFVCKAAGDVLSEAAEKYPSKTINVLCGHTHGEGVYKPRSNLIVYTASAQYGSPVVYKTIELGSS